MAYTAQQLVELITDAREAYHSLVTGRAARVVLDQNGERVEFVSANRQQLYLYIQDLERQYEAVVGVTTTTVTGPAGFVF